MAFDLSRRLAAEALGTGLLVATVVGSGIMADKLTDDTALALLGNTLPTGAILVVLITILGPVSGAHFNPAVTMVFALRREIEINAALAYVVVQIAGGIAGTFLAHAMFELPILQVSRYGADRNRAMDRGGCRCLRPGFHHSGGPALPLRRDPLAGRALYHRRLLVHGVDILRQPGRRHRPRLFRHVFRHPPDRRAGVHCR